jgi:hypothetical protein
VPEPAAAAAASGGANAAAGSCGGGGDGAVGGNAGGRMNGSSSSRRPDLEVAVHSVSITASSGFWSTVFILPYGSWFLRISGAPCLRSRQSICGGLHLSLSVAYFQVEQLALQLIRHRVLAARTAEE